MKRIGSSIFFFFFARWLFIVKSILEESWLCGVFLKLEMHTIHFIWRQRNRWITYLFIIIIIRVFSLNLLIGGVYLGVALKIYQPYFINEDLLFKKNSKEKLGLCYSLQAHDPLNFVKMNYSLILSSLSMILFFFLILTRLCVWIKGLFSEFSYCALDLLISIDSLV